MGRHCRTLQIIYHLEQKGVLKIDHAGIYTVVQHTAKIGFLSPLYRKVGEGGDELFLYSHHHEGRMWLIGRGYDRWNIRLDLVEIIDRQKPAQRYIPGRPSRAMYSAQ